MTSTEAEESNWVYTPTATDLIPEGWFLQNRGDDWICSNAFADGDNMVEFIHENPAETAAQAWLYVSGTYSQILSS